MRYLELLAPAKNIDIGIAAIDCGADAVYIAGPGFGARKAAGNSIDDIRTLCCHAHKFGARIFLTVNTIIYDGELQEAHRMMLDAQDAGVDAFIVQDLALTGWDDIKVPLHASTQCAIRTPEKAAFLESLGFARLVLERELSLPQVEAIRSKVNCELEFFVHGALCVCYSGNCYLSEAIAGRSANRGECIQACRSLYDLEDAKGNVLEKNKALLSLKDYNLKERLAYLAEAGVNSFKIEGRLKNVSYVRNVVREYSLALDELVRKCPDKYARASFGKVAKGFMPASEKTFNRGYTELYLDGKRGKWSSMDAPKSMGERIGVITDIRKIDKLNVEISVKPFKKDVVLANGDGFAIVTKDGITGFRGDVCNGMKICCKSVPAIRRGVEIFRNINAAFEKELERNACKREIAVDLKVSVSGKFDIDISAATEDGRTVVSPFKADLDVAENRERAEAMIREQLSKHSGHYSFGVSRIEVTTAGGVLPLISASILNSIRRLIAEDLDAVPVKSVALESGYRNDGTEYPEKADYRANVANEIAKKVLESRKTEVSCKAYELTHQPGAELMRTRYCIRFELGRCPVHQGARQEGPLFLVNNGRRFALGFDCKACEMTVKEA